MLDHLKTLVVSITSNEVVVSCNQTSISNSWMFQQSEKNEASVNSRTFQGPKVITNTNKRFVVRLTILLHTSIEFQKFVK